MDTRIKIGGNAPRQATVVSGYFDPLLAWHARRLGELKRPGVPLLVVIENPPDPILAANARAELVAALAVVDHVILSSPASPEPHLRLEAADAVEQAALIERIHARRAS